MSKTICIIPARSGSKGIIDKNIINLGGHPLIAWSIKAALESKLINQVYVSTDSEEYKQIAIKYGATVPFLRPSNISKDDSTDIEFVQHFLSYLESENIMPELLIHLRPTTPLRNPDIIDKAIKTFNKDQYTSLRSVHKISTPIEKIFKLSNGVLGSFLDESSELDEYNKPRQEFLQAYEANGYVDILNTNYIGKHNLLHGNKCKGFITKRTHDIDEADDFNELEYFLKNNKIDITKLEKL
tara:strand:- start:892 stop:1614 length:723 start_codon:yes stop_codon:yes gene_type:complete